MITRVVSSTPPGLVVTLALLWLMQSLVDSGAPVEVATTPRLPGAFLIKRQEKPPEPPVIDPPRRLPPPASLPLTRPGRGAGDETGGLPGLDPGPGFPAMPGAGPIGGPDQPGYGDGPLISIVKVAPDYPMSASARGLEGFVTVQFDVNADGGVDNVEIVAASHPVFERAAVDAAYRFRFRPRVVDGTPVTTHGVRNRFRFRLEEE